ncbi:MAG: hypothetical protein OIN66_12080 [Candidatus Methanoperedens sp.]|nr:hypothetical protein [Candidatus Methanoperedens sp.]
MEITRIIPIVLVTLLLFFTGCVGKTPVGTPAPTTTVVTTETPQQTMVPTVPAPTPSLTPSLTPALHAKYIIWLDSDYGFYRVRAVRDNTSLKLPSDFDILNFSIYIGDKVRWMNDDSYDFPLTLVSKEGLWSGRAGLMRYQGEKVEYTFNKTGTYTFYIQEYPRLPQQKITVVNP